MLNAKSLCLLIAAASLLAGCERPKPPGPTFEELRGDSPRTLEIMRLCRDDSDQVSDETCAAASAARREQTMGSGKTKYTPGGVSTKPTDENR